MWFQTELSYSSPSSPPKFFIFCLTVSCSHPLRGISQPPCYYKAAACNCLITGSFLSLFNIFDQWLIWLDWKTKRLNDRSKTIKFHEGQVSAEPLRFFSSLHTERRRSSRSSYFIVCLHLNLCVRKCNRHSFIVCGDLSSYSTWTFPEAARRQRELRADKISEAVRPVAHSHGS